MEQIRPFVETLTHDEMRIIDAVRKVTNGYQKRSFVDQQAELYNELEDIYHDLGLALQNMQEAMNQGEVRQLVQEAATRIYRLLR